LKNFKVVILVFIWGQPYPKHCTGDTSIEVLGCGQLEVATLVARTQEKYGDTAQSQLRSEEPTSACVLLSILKDKPQERRGHPFIIFRPNWVLFVKRRSYLG